ncbi:cytochrome c-type biogenesis protein [Allocatelliglobosispora scoriae]|uniref:Cytochrome c-type biogenesis protein n=1 Tax=Allocatelliglobosispora scoriae TaxID=643052 RepID=A0A841BVM1_9ACTN|nr:cytochrome c biogenesis protein CcdA [Allocatelliglobosispora scoriae]MBB5870791.1 cytochrome c-type biogenesis protein [Allocatelliglobosispora scoriae]
MSGVTDTVLSGPIFAALGVAVLAGMLSFLSPCILPLVPGYLSYVTGLVGSDLSAALGEAEGARRRGRVLTGILLFIGGFSAVFITAAVFAAQLGRTLQLHERAVQIVVGSLIVLFGLAMLGLIPGLQRELRLRQLPNAGLIGAPIFGAVFALSWSPCLGPTLGAMLLLAGEGGDTGRAIALAIAYCLGIGLPFLAVGLGMRRLAGVLAVVRRNARWITRIGGALLIIVGVALITGLWSDFMIWLLTNAPSGESPL